MKLVWIIVALLIGRLNAASESNLIQDVNRRLRAPPSSNETDENEDRWAVPDMKGKLASLLEHFSLRAPVSEHPPLKAPVPEHPPLKAPVSEHPPLKSPLLEHPPLNKKVVPNVKSDKTQATSGNPKYEWKKIFDEENIPWFKKLLATKDDDYIYEKLLTVFARDGEVRGKTMNMHAGLANVIEDARRWHRTKKLALELEQVQFRQWYKRYYSSEVEHNILGFVPRHQMKIPKSRLEFWKPELKWYDAVYYRYYKFRKNLYHYEIGGLKRVGRGDVAR